MKLVKQATQRQAAAEWLETRSLSLLNIHEEKLSMELDGTKDDQEI